MVEPTLKDHLVAEIRFAERLCLRTARLYRRLHSFGIWVTTFGSTAVLAALVPSMPHAISVAGAVAAAAMFAANIAIRPHDKALANEADAKKYAQLRTRALSLDADALASALQQARESDVAEVEPLRDVAYNDVVIELGLTNTVPLSGYQRIISRLA